MQNPVGKCSAQAFYCQFESPIAELAGQGLFRRMTIHYRAQRTDSRGFFLVPQFFRSTGLSWPKSNLPFLLPANLFSVKGHSIL